MLKDERGRERQTTVLLQRRDEMGGRERVKPTGHQWRRRSNLTVASEPAREVNDGVKQLRRRSGGGGMRGGGGGGDGHGELRGAGTGGVGAGGAGGAADGHIDSESKRLDTFRVSARAEVGNGRARGKGSKQATHVLAAVGLGQRLHHHELRRHDSNALLDAAAEPGLVLSRQGIPGRSRNNERDRAHAQERISQADDDTVAHQRVCVLPIEQNGALHLSGAHSVATHVDHLVRSSVEGERTVCVPHCRVTLHVPCARRKVAAPSRQITSPRGCAIALSAPHGERHVRVLAPNDHLALPAVRRDLPALTLVIAIAAAASARTAGE